MSFYRERANNVIITVKVFLLVGLLKNNAFSFISFMNISF